LTRIHPHALAAAAAAEAAALQGRFWDMHELLFHRQKALEDGDLRGYAAQLGLDVAAFDRDRPAAWWLAGSAGMSTAAWPRAGCVHAIDDMVGQRGQRASHEVAPIQSPPG